MPWSIWPTTTESVVGAANVRYVSVASVKQNAIGMPAATQTPTRPTKKTRRLPLPIAAKAGLSSSIATPTPATTATEPASPRQSASSTMRTIATINISTMPITRPSTRYASCTCIAGVRIAYCVTM